LSEAFIHSGSTAWTTVDAGVRRQILGHGPDLMMVSVEFEKGAIGAMHKHPHRQVTFVARGSFRVTVDGRSDTLKAGDCFYVAADLLHGVEALEAGALIDVFTPTRQDFL
jgi:quercetin dioxygenase-like cupin family protein